MAGRIRLLLGATAWVARKYVAMGGDGRIFPSWDGMGFFHGNIIGV